ncbi:unnamed protein product, partial [marine sediment metagenome]
TSRPLYALLFLLPLVVIYELGTLWINTDQVANALIQKRVVTFIWLFNLGRWTGIPRSLVWAFPGFMVIVILLCWHLASRRPWRVRPVWLGWMALESVIFTAPLLLLNTAIGSSTRAAATASGTQSYLAHLVTSIGAGIYEELIFRFILFGLIVMVMENVLKVKHSGAVILAVFVSAALFAAHHYVGIDSLNLEPFSLDGFIFRTLAGIYFALIFSCRGYGVTAGTHAAYNVILITLWP